MDEEEAWCSCCSDVADWEGTWTPQMHRVLELTRELFSTRDGICGGPLHVQLEDLNLDDNLVYNQESVVDYSLPPGYEWKDEAGLRRICDELWPLLWTLTEEERLVTVRTFHEEHYKR